MADTKNKLLLPGSNGGAFSVLNDIWERNAKIAEDMQKNQTLIADILPKTEEFINETKNNNDNAAETHIWIADKLHKLKKNKIENKKKNASANSSLNQIEKDHKKKVEESDKKRTAAKKHITSVSKYLLEKSGEIAKKTVNGNYVEKLIKSTNVAFDSVAKVTNTAASAYTKITTAFGKSSFCTIWESKFGRFFKWLDGPGVTVWSLLKLGGFIWDAIKFIKEGVMTLIEGTYKFMLSLGKLGWKAVSALVTYTLMPIKKVASFMSTAFKFFLTSPTGLLLMIGGLTIAYIYAWPIIKPFFEKLFSNVWKWLTSSFNSILKNIKDTKFYAYLKEGASYVKTQILTLIHNFFDSDKLIIYYNDTIGKWTGLTSEKLSKLFSGIKQFGVSLWGTVMNMFDEISSTNIFKELGITYDIIKTFVMGEGAVVKQKSFNESQRRLKVGLITSLNDQLKSVLQNQLTDEFFATYNGQSSSNAKSGLTKSATDYLNNIFLKNINSLTTDESLKSAIISNLNPNISQIVDEVLDLNITTSNDFKLNALTSASKSATQIDDLYRIHNDRALQTIDSEEALAKQLDEAFRNTRFDTRLTGYLATQNTNRNAAFSEIGEKYKSLEALFDEQTKFETVVMRRAIGLHDEYKSLTDDIFTFRKEIEQLVNNIDGQSISAVIDSFKSFLVNTGLNIKLNDAQAKQLFLRLMKESKRDTSVIDVNDMSKYNLRSVSKAANGMIAIKPTFIQIAEAGSPEMVIPLNHDGVRFISDVMKGVEVNDTQSTTLTRQENIVRTFKNTKRQQPNESIFDMKNIAEGYLGLT